jgi:hypothetical protein
MGKKWGKRGGGGSKKAPPAKKARRESGGGGGGGGSGRGGGGGGRSHGGYTGHIHGPNVKGRPAIIATCDSIQTKYAAKELLNMLGEYADELYPPVAAVVESAPSAERDGSSSGEDDGVDGGGFSISVRVGSPLAARRPGSRGERRSRSRSGGSRSGSSKQDDGGSHLPAIGMARVSSSSSSARSSR